MLRFLPSIFLATAIAGMGALTQPVSAQDDPAVNTTPSVLPRPDYRFEGTIGRTVEDSSKAAFPQPLSAPQGAPNVVLILLDDVGYGQMGTFGGATPTPALDQLAEEGLRFTHMHTTAICSPTRAALLTGRNHHIASFGGIAESATGYDGYTAVIPKRTGMVAEVLKQNGYATAWIGKNHNTPSWEISPRGPFNNWPTAWGFNYFYGFQGGQTSQWEPLLFENHTPVPRSEDPDYHLTRDLVDRSIHWVDTVTAVSDEPYFLYLAPGATHAPHHAPQEYIDRFAGQFDDGWDVYREETFARQKELGVIPADTVLTPRPDALPAWDSLEPDQKKVASRMMEVFAAFTAHTDHEVGRLLDHLRQSPDWDNTMVIYIAGDNGSSAEGGLLGTIDEVSYYNGFAMPWEDALPVLDEIGGPTLHNHFPVAWAWAMNTPFQWTKQVASHFGGTRNPMVITWPGRIDDAGGMRTQFKHVVNITPTIYEVTGITPPEVLNGVEQDPFDGESLACTFDDADAPSRHLTQYFEIYANRAICDRGWCAASIANIPWQGQTADLDLDALDWELYNIEEDFSQANNLAEAEPEKLRELQDLWWATASRNNVLPVDTRPLDARVDFDQMPTPAKGRTSITYRPGVGAILEGAAPALRNTSFTLTAKVDIPEDGADGMLLTVGGYTAGLAWYVQDGRQVFSYNYFTDRTRIEADAPLPSGEQVLRAEFIYEGGGEGKAADIRLYTGDVLVAEGRLDQTVPVAFSSFDGLDVGLDRGAPVDRTYQPPFAFTGDLESVKVDFQ